MSQGHHRQMLLLRKNLKVKEVRRLVSPVFFFLFFFSPIFCKSASEMEKGKIKTADVEAKARQNERELNFHKELKINL